MRFFLKYHNDKVLGQVLALGRGVAMEALDEIIKVLPRRTASGGPLVPSGHEGVDLLLGGHPNVGHGSGDGSIASSRSGHTHHVLLLYLEGS